MQLLIISGRLAVGGAERFVSNLLLNLDRSKIDSSLCLLENRIEYQLPTNLHLSILHHCQSWNYLRKIFFIRQVIVQQKPDIILSNIALVNRLTGAALIGMQNKPHWIARVGNNPEKGGRNQFRNMVNMAWDKIAYKQVDRFVVNSNGLKKALASVHKYSKGKTTVLYNPINLSTIETKSTEKPKFNKPKNRLLLISAGRFHRQKRYDLLIESFAEISRVLPVELWICGEGYLRTSIEKSIVTHNLTEKIKLLGYCSNVFAVLRQADLFLLTSDWEGMPNALIEAMSLGIPCVATDCPYGPSELITPGKNGLLAEPGNTADITMKTLSLLKNEQRHLIGEQAKNSIRKVFDFNTVMKEWCDFLENYTAIDHVK